MKTATCGKHRKLLCNHWQARRTHSTTLCYIKMPQEITCTFTIFVERGIMTHELSQ